MWNIGGVIWVVSLWVGRCSGGWCRYSFIAVSWLEFTQIVNVKRDSTRLCGGWCRFEEECCHKCGGWDGTNPQELVLLSLPLLPTGHYWIRTSTGSAVLVYCDPTRSCDGVTGGHALGQSGRRGQ